MVLIFFKDILHNNIWLVNKNYLNSIYFIKKSIKKTNNEYCT